MPGSLITHDTPQKPYDPEGFRNKLEEQGIAKRFEGTLGSEGNYFILHLPCGPIIVEADVDKIMSLIQMTWLYSTMGEGLGELGFLRDLKTELARLNSKIVHWKTYNAQYTKGMIKLEQWVQSKGKHFPMLGI